MGDLKLSGDPVNRVYCKTHEISPGRFSCEGFDGNLELIFGFRDYSKSEIIKKSFNEAQARGAICVFLAKNDTLQKQPDGSVSVIVPLLKEDEAGATPGV